jgi:hypothetical protein
MSDVDDSRSVINADRADAEHPTLNAQTTLGDAMGGVRYRPKE